MLASNASCSVIGHAEHSSASTDPVLRVLVGGQVHHHDEVSGVTGGGQLSSSLGSLVERALVSPIKLQVDLEDGLKPDDRELRNGNLVVHVLNHLLLVVPLSTFNEVTVDHDTCLREFLNGFHKATHDVGLKSELINFEAVGTGMHLEGSGFETLREEEAGNPVRQRHAFFNPSAHEDDTLKEVIEPRLEGLERRIGPGDPHAGYFTVEEIVHHLLEGLRHDDSTFDSFVQVDQRLADNINQQVESVKLLSEEHTKGERLVVFIKLKHIGMSGLTAEVLGYSGL